MDFLVNEKNKIIRKSQKYLEANLIDFMKIWSKETDDPRLGYLWV